MLLQMSVFHSFIRLSSILLHICTSSPLSLHLSMDKLVAHALAIVNSAAMNTGCMYVFQLGYSLDICPGMELLHHMVVLFLVF